MSHYELEIHDTPDGCVEMWLSGYEARGMGGLYHPVHWFVRRPGILARLLGDTFKARLARMIRKVTRIQARLDAARDQARSAIEAARKEELNA